MSHRQCSGIENVLFDLDGTLVDSSDTIAACIDYALERVGANPLRETPVSAMIGEPLLDIFGTGYGLSDGQTDAAIDFYREHYDALEQAGSNIYDGIDRVLSDLRKAGFRLFIATVKPAPIADKVLSDLQLRPYFEGISGSSMDHVRRTKAGIIAYALDTWNLDPALSMMVGDRGQDILGARENGMRATAVTYGFGSRGELDAAGPDHMIGHSSELPALLMR
jgi:phosphoglycolate phosphatase